MSVGYIPGKLKTRFGYEIDQSVKIPPNGDPGQRAAMERRYGPDWERGTPGFHAISDFAGALERCAALAKRGLSAPFINLLAEDFDGVPRLDEIYDAYYGQDTRVTDLAHQLYPGEFGYGTTPFAPSDREETAGTGYWKAKIAPPAGRFRGGVLGRLKDRKSRELIELIEEQIRQIEAGLVPGWTPPVIDFMGWIPSHRLVKR